VVADGQNYSALLGHAGLLRTEVVQLNPRRQPFEVAVEAYRGGRSDDCVALLHGHGDLASKLLRARSYLRSGRVELGLDCLAPIDDADLPTHRARAELLILRGALQTRLRDFDTARESLDLGRVYAFGSASAAVEAEFHYYDAMWFFGVSDLDEADRAAQDALMVAPPSFTTIENDYFVPAANSRARALNIRGLVAAARERYGAQLHYVRTAVREIQTAETMDQWIFASLLMNLSFQVRDFDLVDDARALRENLARMQWPGELAMQQFYIYQSLAWSNALRGDHLSAFRDLRLSKKHAPTPVFSIWASVDRAFLGRELGEMTFAREELEHSADVAAQIAWDTVLGDERIALAFLAQELAAFEPAQARTLMERYRRIKSKLAPNLLNALDRRVRAYELRAEATIMRANGETAAAMRRFCEAFEIWDGLGYRWLASTAAIELAELSDVTSRFREYGRREAALRPNSWLARRVAALDRD